MKEELTKVRKKGVNGRAKGAGYENKVAKLLAKWSGQELRRTPLSGGWARKNAKVSGDIVSITEGLGLPFSVECKNNEDWEMEAILRGRCKAFESWWGQCTKACPDGKIPLLIFSKAYSEDWVVIEQKHLDLSKFRLYITIDQRVIVKLGDLLQLTNISDYMENSEIGKEAAVQQRESNGASSSIHQE